MDTLTYAISQVDWNTYKSEVLYTLRLAMTRFSAEHSHSSEKRVWQVSIWTDPQVFITCIAFETKAHADESVSKSAAYWRSKKDEDTARAIEKQGINPNPAGFEFTEYECINHSGFDRIKRIAYYEIEDQRRLVETTLETHLLSVQQQILNEHTLDALHSDNEVIIGISSSDDWYDHLQIIEFLPHSSGGV